MLRISLVFCFLCLLLLSQSITAQIVNEKPKTEVESAGFPNLQSQADEMIAAIQGNNFERFTDFMYPKLIETVGGREKFIKLLKASSQLIAESGVEIKSYKAGKPLQTVEFDNEIFVILPTEIEIKISKDSENLIKQTGALLAISSDNKTNWKFVRIESKEKLKVLFPEIADKLKLPAGFNG